MPSMHFQTHKGADRQTDMIALRDFEAKLNTFNAGKLLQAAMIDFDLPGNPGRERHTLPAPYQSCWSPNIQLK
ncbi:MAG: hypothetical protein GYB65_04035 [Chloroflexi bacterium]|nr:hypothetical protein [Chloroflexota bacterium]